MKIGMHNWMRPEPLAVTLRRLHDLGFDGISIMAGPGQYDAAETRRLLVQYNLECWCIVTSMAGDRDLLHADDNCRAMTLDYVQACIDLAHDVGAPIVTTLPSQPGKTIPMADAETEWRWSVEGLKVLADHARGKNVRIALELANRLRTYFLNRHDQALRLIEDVGEDIGVALDTFHMNIEEANPYQAIVNTGDRLFDFHVADNNRYPPGYGTLDWSKLIAALKQANYTGYIMGEFVIPMDRTPLRAKPDDADTANVDMALIRGNGGDFISEAQFTQYTKDTIDFLRANGA
ncbi:MAG: sugar phosphate isomerase/epimerase [Anaerolineae bacterium]|nr:sugar phosphate isomerase/epimerase [Anaerolineae bacterium]